MLLRKQLAIIAILFAASTRAAGQRLPAGIGEPEVSLYARVLAMTDTRQLDTALVGRALASK
ncbi:MAG: hypothetical protein M3081_09600, partial [Gemmatimonadota bacterium]|nr:hypothetical protein [Gemmatimonadota bacterium]